MPDLSAIIRQHSRELLPAPTDVEPQLHKLLGIKAVLLDVYGTLLISGSGDVGTAGAMDWNSAIEDSWNNTCQSQITSEQASIIANGIKEAIAREHAALRSEGITKPEIDIRDMWRAVLNELNAEGRVTELFDDDELVALSLEVESRINPVWPMPNLASFFADLQQRQLAVGIISNAQYTTPLLFPALTDKTVHEFGVREDLCVWSYLHKASKPDPRMFPTALDVLVQENIKPCEVVYVGNDMLNDVYSAQEAGCKAVLFAGDNRSLRWRSDDERCKNRKPDAIITDLSQMSALLEP